MTGLRSVLTEDDLRRWMFTDLVVVDASIRRGFSHPLTIGPGLLTGRPASALATFLHEQLHLAGRARGRRGDSRGQLALAGSPAAADGGPR
jgi:hypothetical protein